MTDPIDNTNPKNETAEETDLFQKIDIRPLFLDLRGKIPVLLLIFVVILTFSGLAARIFKRKSMRNWTAVAKVFHQTRSEKVPAFYKQLDTKSIVELLSTSGTMQRAAKKLNLGKDSVHLLRRQVKVSVAKNKADIITITADFKTPRMASDLANAVAEAGVEEYVELQNATLKGMLTERRRRRTQLSNELESLELELPKYSSGPTSFAPDEELARVRTLIAERILKLEDLQAKTSEYRVKVEGLQNTLSSMDREIRYMHKIHGGDGSELERMRKELVNLEQNYTDKNPRVVRFRAQVREREEFQKNKKQEPDEIVFSANQVYLSLEAQLLRTQLDQKAIQQNIIDYQAQLDKYRKYAGELVERMSGYNEQKRRIASAKSSIKQLEVSINDLDFLLNSTIPDLSVLELAVPPTSANRNNMYFIAVFAAVMTTAVTAMLFVLYSFFAGKVRTAREMQILLEGDNLGEIPASDKPFGISEVQTSPEGESGAEKNASAGRAKMVSSLGWSMFSMETLLPSEKVSPQEVQASTLEVFKTMRNTVPGERQKIFLYELSNSPDFERVILCWLEHFGVQGLKTFRLKCVPRSQMSVEKPSPPKNTAHSPVDDELICVEKYANKGFFYYNDELFLAPAECDLLREDLSQLLKYYDLILIEHVEMGKDPGQSFIQMTEFADYSVVMAEFGKTPKSFLRRIRRELFEHFLPIRIGGILLGTKPPYWRG